MGHFWDTQRQITTINGNKPQQADQINSLIELL